MKREDGLAKRIHQFNVLPAQEAHVSHFPEWQDHLECLDLVRHDATACRILARSWMEKVGWSREECWDFREPRWRLVLLEPGTARDLLSYGGAAYHHQRIAHEVRHDPVEALVMRYGEALPVFAVKRAPILAGSMATLPEPPAGATLVEAVENAGRRLFELALADVPGGVLARFASRFSAHWNWQWNPVVDGAIQDAAWHCLRRILLRELDPRLAPCFE